MLHLEKCELFGNLIKQKIILKSIWKECPTKCLKEINNREISNEHACENIHYIFLWMINWNYRFGQMPWNSMNRNINGVKRTKSKNLFMEINHVDEDKLHFTIIGNIFWFLFEMGRW
jgi:hypothetical protein